MLDELLQVKSPDSFQRGAYTASDKALHGKKSLATTDYLHETFIPCVYLVIILVCVCVQYVVYVCVCVCSQP